MIKHRAKPLPVWAEDALHGICYWIGHRRAVYRHHALTEGAVVAELANLISHRLRDDNGRQLYLYCEVLYRHILRNKGSQGTDRVDLLVAPIGVDKGSRKTYDFSRSATCVVEVKLARSSRKACVADMERLAMLVRDNPKLAAFLIVVGEGKIPYLVATAEAEGKALSVRAKPGVHAIGDGAYYSVRRVCFATPSLKSLRSAHVACLVEVTAQRAEL